ncbi:MAG: hypothetical protein JHC31_05575, partial [Sulfurihydrogenibium sp.]|nr:hypothetical protein [Sulfurihydrogenibium sp.]
MTKKKKVHDNNNDNFDKEFEDLFGEDDFDGNFNDEDFLKESGNGRSTAEPGIARKVVETAGTSAAASFSKKLLEKTLPIEYTEYSSDAIGLVDFSKDVFDKSKEQLRRPIARFATEVKKLTPQSFTTVNNILDKFIGEKEEGTQSQEQMQEAAIASSLSSIFDKQIEVQKTLEANRLAREDAEQKVEFKTQQRNSYYLSSIQAAAETQTNFTLNVAKDYYKKSLELQFRSYYAQTDLLRTTKDYFKAFSVQLDNITKNTGLPDALKIKSSERLIEEMKKKATSNIYGRFIDNNEYLNKVKENIAKMVQYKVSDIADKIDSATDVVSQVVDAKNMDMSLTGAVAELGAAHAGDVAGEYGAKKLAPRIKNWVRNNKYVKKGANFLSAFGTSPQTFFQSLPGTFGEIKDAADSKTGAVSSIVSALAGKAQDVSSVFDVSGADLRKAAKQDITTLREPAIFDQHYHRSVTQVIPLYLSHILRENTVQSKALLAKLTEEEKAPILNTPYLSYDFNANKLVETKELAANYGKFIKNKLGINKVKSGSERIIGAINAAGGSINPMEREAFNRSIEKLNSSGFDMNKLDFDKIEEGSELEKEIKGILGDDYNSFSVAVKNYKRLKADKKEKAKQQIKEAIGSISEKQLENIVKRFMDKFFSLPFIIKDIRDAVGVFTDAEIESISYSIMKTFIEYPSKNILPMKESIMFFLRFIKPLPKEEDNKVFKQKLGIWINVSNIAYQGARGEVKAAILRVYGELNTEFRKVAQAVDAGFIRSIFEANPELNINPDKDIPDWNIIHNGDFLKALNEDKESYMNINDIPSNINEEAKKLIQENTNSNLAQRLEQLSSGVSNLLKQADARAGSMMQNLGNLAKITVTNAGNKMKQAHENVKKFTQNLRDAKTPQEAANLVIRAFNNITIASVQSAKMGVTIVKSNLDKLGELINEGLTSQKAKDMAIKIVDTLIEASTNQIAQAKKSNEELQELIKASTGIQIQSGVQLTD